MTRLSFSGVAAFLTAAALATSLPGCTPPPRAIYGVHQDLTYEFNLNTRRRAINAVHNGMHAKISRSTLAWNLIEKTRGQPNWQVVDSVLYDLTNAGIEPMFTITNSPQWANGSSQPEVVPPAGAGFDTWLNNYAKFVTTAVQRYNKVVKKWQLWNEPNLNYFWKPQPNAALYARFYTRIRSAIKAVDPSAQVSMGPVASLTVVKSGVGMTGINFLKAVHQQGANPEIVSIHPYTFNAPDQTVAGKNNFTDIAKVRSYQVSANKVVPLWVTEWGWSTQYISYSTQAAYVKKSLEMIRDRYTYVTVATIFLDYDRPTRWYQGMFTASFTPKPAATTFRAFVDTL